MPSAPEHLELVVLYHKMAWFIIEDTLWSFEAATQKHWDSLFQQRFIRLYGDKQHCDKLRGKVCELLTAGEDTGE